MVKELSFVRRYVEFEPHSCYVLVGLRRAGKSYMLYQRIHDLLQQGHSIEEILYFNFEDDRLADIQLSDLDLIKQAYEELFAHKPIFMLDEIQLVDGWEKFARRHNSWRTLYSSKCISIFLHGIPPIQEHPIRKAVGIP